MIPAAVVSSGRVTHLIYSKAMTMPSVLKISLGVLVLVAVLTVLLLALKPEATDFPDTPDCGPQGIARSLDAALANPSGTCSLLITDQPDLAQLPPSLGQLEQLTQLAVRNASLTALPPELGQLTNLRMLDLRGNHLTSLPPELGNLTELHTLILSNNNIANVPDAVAGLQKLVAFELDGNPLELNEQQRIQSWFSGFSVWFGAAPEDIPAPAE